MVPRGGEAQRGRLKRTMPARRHLLAHRRGHVGPRETTSEDIVSANIRHTAFGPPIPVRSHAFDTALIPSVALLSNGHYGVMITAAGAGYSTWQTLDVSRWREDATRDCWGQFCYVRDPAAGTIWSVGYQPLCGTVDEYEFAFHADSAEFHR